MQELPVLSPVARKILKCCVYNLDDMRRFGCKIYPHMIHSYFDKKFPTKQQISEIEIIDIILYFAEVNLATDIDYDLQGNLQSFRLTHTGFYYFEIEKMLKSQYRKKLLCDSFLLPIFISAITTFLTLLLSA